MPYTRKEMDDVFETCQYWYIDHHGNLKAETVSRPKHRPTEQDFESDHPLLPSALRSLISLDERTRSGSATAPASQAYFTRFLLHRPHVDVVDATGSTWKFALMSRFFQPENTSQLRMTGAAVDTVMTQIAGETVQLVTKVHWLDMDIPKILLDAQYPGWSERIVVAEQLGVEPDDLLQYVLSKPKTGASTIDFTSVNYS